jgi:hypothetical protein
VPSIHSPLNHSPPPSHPNHNNNQFKSESSVKSNLINEIDESSIKREPNAASENEFDLSYHFNNNNNHENNNSSKKTMNDVLKLLTNKMRGSTLKEGRKGSTEQDFESKM